MHILGVRIDNLTKKEILEKIEFFLNENKFHQIATVNPEFIVKAQGDQKFKSILNQCDLNIADGIGLKYAFLRNGAWLKFRYAGADLMLEILKVANKKGISVCLAINNNGLSSLAEIEESLKEKFPNIDVDGNEIAKDDYSQYKIQNTKCKILLCNFGAPHQEKFLNAQKNGTICLAMGVGGGFDFLTGKIKRAPLLMRLVGLEWLYRLMQEPKYRIKRIYKAVIIFPIKVILNR